MHPSEEASALLFPATELFKAAASVRRGLRGSHTHTTPPCCTWAHSFPKSLAHTWCPGHLQFCNITQQQYSLNCLAVYFLKRGKVSHLKDYLTLPWTSCPPSPLLSLRHHVHTCVYTQMATYMHIHWHIDTWMNRLKHIRPALGWQLWKDRDEEKKKHSVPLLEIAFVPVLLESFRSLYLPLAFSPGQ